MEDLYNEYKALLEAGKSEEEALSEFNYMHPVQLSRFKAFISLVERREALGAQDPSDPAPNRPRLAK